MFWFVLFVLSCLSCLSCLPCFVLFALFCLVLSCFVLFCLVFSCFVLFCLLLYCIVLYCILFYFILIYLYLSINYWHNGWWVLSFVRGWSSVGWTSTLNLLIISKNELNLKNLEGACSNPVNPFFKI